MDANISLRFLGPVQLERDQQPLKGLRSRKAIALLGYLAATPSGAARAFLATLFWPELDERPALNNLSWAIAHLNSHLPGCCATERGVVRLQPQPALWCDLAAFAELSEGETRASLGAAVELYRGELLEGFRLEGCPDFEHWLGVERVRWQQRATRALETLIQHERARGAYRQALPYAQRLIALDPGREQAHRFLMSLLALDGQRDAALAQYEQCRRILAEQFGLQPEAETLALARRIREGERLSEAAPRLESWQHLPSPHTSFVDRVTQQARIGELLTSGECRLLTIVGLGGIGKTRLALRMADNLRPAFRHGVHVVPLAPVSAGDGLISALAEALKLNFASNADPRQQLLRALAGKEQLLVLDNFEHLLEEAGLLGELLQRAPKLRLLVTSRERLQLAEERQLQLQGLELPQSDSEQEAAQAGAVRLFAERARQVDQRFALAPENLGAVVEVCRLVEGSPLGIELAASWADRLSPAEIVQAIRDSIDTLSTEKHDVPQRQRSMRAVFEGAWGMLGADEQRALRELAVFHGSFGQDAALAVTHAETATMGALEEQSLLRRTPGGRYELHELVRYCAEEKLHDQSIADEGEQARVSSRHSAFYLGRLAQAEAQLWGAQPQLAVGELRGDLDNLRRAWRWAVEQGALDDLGRSLSGLAGLYELLCLYQEGELVFERTGERLQQLAQGRALDPALQQLLQLLRLKQVRFLIKRGMLDRAIALAEEVSAAAQRQQAPELEAEAAEQWGEALLARGLYKQSQAHCERALALARSIPLPRLEASCLFNLARLSAFRGDHRQGRLVGEEALRAVRLCGDRRGENRILSYLGFVSWLDGSQQAAREYQELCLQGCREVGQRLDISQALRNLADISWPVGEYQRAKAMFEEALAIERELGYQQGSVIVLAALGRLLICLGCYGEASQHVGESLQIAREIGLRRFEAINHSLLGLLAHHQGDQRLAQRYLREGIALAETLGDLNQQAEMQTVLGYALEHGGLLVESRQAYQSALELWARAGQQDWDSEALAGLARIALADGDQARALELLETMLENYQRHGFSQSTEPIRIYLTCLSLLRLQGDAARARNMLQDACDWLDQRAGRIDDPLLRRSFLEDVAAHRELRALAESGELLRAG